MAIEQRNVYFGPHWKRDPSLIKVPDSEGLFTIPVRALNITWGNDPHFWQWIKLNEEETKSTGFVEAALLDQVNWLEVTGKLDISSMKLAMDKTYTVYYILKFTVDAFGWHSVPIKFRVKKDNAQEIKPTELLLEPYRKKPNEWHEIPVGKLNFVEDKETQVISVIEFGMFEVDSDRWKGGMVLGGIKFMPDYNGHELEFERSADSKLQIYVGCEIAKY
ncbi:hypothetical protein ACH5RR_015841 [Cinchona calisaya]|uniref:Phloem protein 2 n=1 Tax=Cinchona calisaya TaxID=153742 RepID=A0ABD2ZXX4_9GENT